MKVDRPKKKPGCKPGQVHAGLFKPGNKVAAASALPPEMKAVRNSTREELFSTFSKYMRLTRADVDKIDRSILTLLELGVLRSLDIFSDGGDYNSIKYPLDQIIGRAKESIDIGLAENDTVKISVNFKSDNETDTN
jgi:hypothetical protein